VQSCSKSGFANVLTTGADGSLKKSLADSRYKIAVLMDATPDDADSTATNPAPSEFYLVLLVRELSARSACLGGRREGGKWRSAGSEEAGEVKG
jgi:hypothetical protein